MPNHSVTLYTAGTPNGYCVSATLEELGVVYDLKAISFDKKEQKTPEFLRLNPNGRIPVIVDHANNTKVFETIAIMLYLADKYDKERKISFEPGTDLYYEQLQWLAWAQGGLGPMQGQANHFVRYAPEKIEYGIKRYTDEGRRLYQILEDRLGQQDWLVGGIFSLADLKAVTWVRAGPWATITNLEFEGYPNLKNWVARIEARPASHRGFGVPKRTDMRESLANAEKISAAARKNFGFGVAKS